MGGLGYVLCAWCSAVKERQRSTWCDACGTRRGRELKAQRDALIDPAVAVARSMRSRRKAWHSIATRPVPERCEICGEGDYNATQSKPRILALDHCHTTGLFRGWLCFPCNVAIGKLGDSAAGVRKALAYLERFESSIEALNEKSD